ncbi:uncharacterized protein LOC120908824 [Anopheles arabiensis]|uniref:uncharacterized protein LOC120908824 n=1 Tax=Anopheles arabiensis TaxID=7173 RepID=UPI001AAC7CBE|nr:uncharacterized protein LOC120908824 [Anopheles arabiensis]
MRCRREATKIDADKKKNGKFVIASTQREYTASCETSSTSTMSQIIHKKENIPKNISSTLLQPEFLQTSTTGEESSTLNLHPQLLHELSCNSIEHLDCITNIEQNTPMPSCQKSTKHFLPTFQSTATQTNFLNSGEQILSDILVKLENIQEEQKRQAEMMNNKFAAMDRQIKLIRSEFNIVTDELITRSGFVQQTYFEWEPVKNQEDLDNLECRLAEPEFKKNFSKYLDNQLSTEGSDDRLHDAMDIFSTESL